MRVLPTEKNRQNKFHQNSLKIVAVALERKCRFYISLSRVSGYFGWVPQTGESFFCESLLHVIAKRNEMPGNFTKFCNS